MLLLVVAVYTSSCERDDICAEATATTPHLIIRFYDINDSDELKQVRQLSASGFDANGNELGLIYQNRDLDSIVLPLNFQNENILTTSTFKLKKDSDFDEDEEDEDDETESNIDVITVSYIPKFEYVSRACGYRSVFTNLSITVEPDSDNWIISNEILTTTIENETSAHVILRH